MSNFELWPTFAWPKFQAIQDLQEAWEGIKVFNTYASNTFHLTILWYYQQLKNKIHEIKLEKLTRKGKRGEDVKSTVVINEMWVQA